MARHPEVSEAEIISAGSKLISQGKTPNPGAIRAALGDRGGLARIKSVWEEHLSQQGELDIRLNKDELSYADLPSDVVQAVDAFITAIQKQIQRVTVDAYERSRFQFEKRLQLLESQWQQRLAYYEDYEQEVDMAFKKMQKEISVLDSETTKLAQQNADLLLENSELKGRLHQGSVN